MSDRNWQLTELDPFAPAAPDTIEHLPTHHCAKPEIDPRFAAAHYGHDLKQNIAPAQPDTETLKAQLEQLERKIVIEQTKAAHWKANHDNMVTKNAFLSQRPDLPVDRIPAYQELVQLRAQIAAQAGQEPVAWYIRSKGGFYLSEEAITPSDRKLGFTELFDHPAPALSVDSELGDMMDKAEDEYWHNLGLREEAERDDVAGDANNWRELLEAVIRETPNKFPSQNLNAPGHSHSIPGIWDSDNIRNGLAGKQCAWCFAWNKASAAIAASTKESGCQT